ncbi:accessory gene regulator B family protein [Paenibacillus sp. FJAT-26967]|uniref:accessory gene regulator B family protein n=1 Tax=Paenibacillus sp. FJAT-26967 TaxID=1729690 RepID=UPI00083845C6|nr:accessory gene regulator B family protein [Paenibacillus sp. FJAT-26967]
MNYVNKYADSLANKIKSAYPEGSSVEVNRLGLIVILNQLIVMSLVLLICLFTGHFWSAFLCSIVYPILRDNSGGFHFRSSTICNIITATFVIIAVHSSFPFWNAGFILNLGAAIILFIYAPSGIKQSRLDKKYYPLIKLLAVLIVSINFFLQWEVLSVLFFIQACTTITFFQKVLDKYNL